MPLLRARDEEQSLGEHIFNNTTNTSVIKHALVPNGWVGGWVGGVMVGGGGGRGRGAKAKVHSTFWVVGGVGGVGWVVVVVVVGGAKAKVHSIFWAVCWVGRVGWVVVVVVVVVVGGRRQRCIVPSGW